MSLHRRTFLKFGTAITAGALMEPIFSPFSQAISPDITHGPRDQKKIALTFHGAGSTDYAGALLDIFKSTSTPVSVFAIGSWLKANPGMAKKSLTVVTTLEITR